MKQNLIDLLIRRGWRYLGHISNNADRFQKRFHVLDCFDEYYVLHFIKGTIVIKP